METFSLKPTIYFGPDALSALEGLSGRVLIVTDGFLAHKSGLLERVTTRLSRCQVGLFDAVEPDPSLQLAAQGVKFLRDFGPNAVLAFGGGSPMDCAKAMRYFAGGPPLPLWCVPTTAGSGSEATSFAVLTDREKGVKLPLVDNALLPDAAVLAPEFLAGAPGPVTADSGLDVLAHAAEAAAARGATPFTDALAEKSFSMAWNALPAARQGDHEARGEMLLAACLAGIAFNSAGLGLCHALAHALGGAFPVPHGRLNSLLLPAVISFNAASPSAAKKYARLAGLCGLTGTPRALSAALARLRHSLGGPDTLAACGVDKAALEEKLDPLAAAALADRCVEGNPIRPTEGEIRDILRSVS